MYVKLTDGTPVTLVQARYDDSQPVLVDEDHVALTDQNRARALGLGWQQWRVTGEIADPTTVLWHDIAQISVDNSAWRTCHVTNVAWPLHLAGQHTYELTLLVSTTAEGAAVRFPATGYQWGLSSLPNVLQAGNEDARPEIHYLAPLFYFPLQQDVQDFAGRGLTFTRTLSKTHAGVSYAVNMPAFDNGLFLGTDIATDTPKWTPAVSTLKSIACQIKQTRYPSAWSIGQTGGNLLTANQSNVETNTTGFAGSGGTMTRDTAAPLAGAASLKMVATGGTNAVVNTGGTKATVVAGRWYCGQVLVKTTGCAAGRKVNADIVWYQADGTTYISEEGLDAAVDAPTAATMLSFVRKAPANAARAMLQVWIVGAAASETLYVDSLMLEELPTTLTVWTAALNKLTISTTANTVSWTDDTTTVSATFPTSDYMAGTVVDLVAIDSTSHAVTLAAHATGGAWTTQTGTLAAIAYPELTLGPLEGSMSNLIEYPYALASAEYQALNYSLLPLLFNTLYIANNRAEEIIKGSDGTLKTASGTDISGNLAGADILITGTTATITMSQGLAARWYLNVKRTDV